MTDEWFCCDADRRFHRDKSALSWSVDQWDFQIHHKLLNGKTGRQQPICLTLQSTHDSEHVTRLKFFLYFHNIKMFCLCQVSLENNVDTILFIEYINFITINKKMI